MLRHQTLATLCCAYLSSQSIYAQELTPSLLFKFQSEPIYRGLSESPDSRAVSLTGDLAFSDNWLVGIDLTNSFSGQESLRGDSVSAFLSYNQEWLAGTVVGISVVRRTFHDSDIEWDYNELQARLSWPNNFGIALSYSDDYYHHGGQSWIVEADWFYSLSSDTYLIAEAGVLNFEETPVKEYAFAKLGVGWRAKAASVELSYGLTTREGRRIFGQSIESPEWQLQFNYLLW